MREVSGSGYAPNLWKGGLTTPHLCSKLSGSIHFLFLFSFYCILKFSHYFKVVTVITLLENHSS